ncbi:TonB-dependent receptor [Porphyrobacter algicida]|uniref:TonB-dependent receptor n=1 Tax=Qipengyuania algicida TaxID=1836209 RepID=A0A845AIK1_9SPHN|nr:TonB-dependent receptor [Qipengyuania algicida]MXP29267.1 TonB-dependent receptor [Qipengyuania algicida]
MRTITSLRIGLATTCAFAAIAASAPAVAQDQSADQATSAPSTEISDRTIDDNSQPASGQEIVVTGSRIKQDPTNSALPLKIFTSEDLTREGINSPEQLISYLASNGNGADNLASNSDVTSGAQRGTNGLSAANLRGQGSASTLVLLNGRRVAAHGLTGSAVDVNQIPFAALERVEVLNDGASAIYGTDAIGGVINFITKTDFQGVSASGYSDITQEGDSPIYRLTGTVGYGDLDKQGFNIMASVSKSWNGILRGSDRAFVNGNQPNRGLSIDTRGTPIATIFPNGANAIFAPDGSLLSGADLTVPGQTFQATGGVNTLNLPGGAGCESFDGGMAYDYELWANNPAYYACAWDTGRAAVLQQPIDTLTYYSRATVAIGEHRISAEFTGSDATSSKIFSSNQYAGNTSTTPLYYPLNSNTKTTYDSVYDQLAAVFPSIGAVGDRTVDNVGNYGRPIAYRWRCTACGPREYITNTKTYRAGLFADGPIAGDWNYNAGISYARSESNSVLGTGYSYRGIFSSQSRADASGVAGAMRGDVDPRAPTAPGASEPGIIGLLNSGLINVFSDTKTPEELALLQSVSADGTVLYGGIYDVWQGDASVSGSLFELPGGMVKLAAGVDWRRESYTFNGSPDAAIDQPEIFNVAFDNANALQDKTRTVKAAYAELQIPLLSVLELSAAGRVDDYSGFGSTFNPKFSVKFTPTNWLMFRGSYGTGFRVPTFNQIYNAVSQSPNPGNTLVDPTTCPGGAVSSAPGCAAITPDTLFGGNLNLGPETSKQYSVGVVFRPARRWSATADFWSISVDNVIGALTLQQALDNIQYLDPSRFTRTNGVLTLVDLTYDNIGSRRTKGIDVSFRGGADLFGGSVDIGLDGTWLLEKKQKLFPTAPYEDQLGVFTFAGDLGLEWKHNAWINYRKDNFTFTFSQIFRSGYENQELPGVANGTVSPPDFNPRVKPYIIYNMTVSQQVTKAFKITAGIKNVFNTDPPFAITYDSNTGAGSSWEPRVADPRGRSFTILAQVNF